MEIAWSKIVEIGDPVVDSEHRYITQLINNFFEQSQGSNDVDLNGLLAHLAKYVRVHFRNEELLMQAIGYPEQEEHQSLHRGFEKKLMGLSEEYLDGSEAAAKDLFTFLEDWWVDHIAVTDTTMKAYIKDGRPAALDVTPAFAVVGGSDFKTCTMCDKSWASFDELAADSTKEVKGCQIDGTNHLYNLIMFNCSCGTTLAIFLKDLVTKVSIPFVIDNNTDPKHRPDCCLQEDKEKPCLERCACGYTQQVLDALG